MPQVLQHALADPADEVGLQRTSRPSRRARDARKRRRRGPASPTSPGDDAVVDRQLGQRRRRQRRGRARRSARRTSAIDAPAVGPQQLEQPAQLAPAAAVVPRSAGARSSRRGRGVGRAAHSPATSALARLAREEHLVGQALARDLARTASSARAARRACRARRSAPSSSTTISSASAIVERRWAMTNVVRPAIDLAQRGLDRLLGRGVDRRGRVVEDEDPRVGEQRARDRDPLALAAARASARARRSRVS